MQNPNDYDLRLDLLCNLSHVFIIINKRQGKLRPTWLLARSGQITLRQTIKNNEIVVTIRVLEY